MGVFFPYPSKAYLRRRGGIGLLDTCQRLVQITSDSILGPDTVETYNEGASMACLLNTKLMSDVQGETEVTMLDAELYLARTATLGSSDRVRITHLQGDEVATPQTFEIVKGPVLGKTFLIAGLKLVTDGSDEDE